MLVFISDNTLGFIDELPINPIFISYAIYRGSMFYARNTTFVLDETQYKPWGTKYVFGAIYSVTDIDFYISVLDKSSICSLGVLGKNTVSDFNHRVKSYVTPIDFDDLESLAVYKFTLNEPIEVYMYLGNLRNPAVKNALKKRKFSRRVHEGICATSFKKNYYKRVGKDPTKEI